MNIHDTTYMSYHAKDRAVEPITGVLVVSTERSAMLSVADASYGIEVSNSWTCVPSSKRCAC